MIKKRCFKNFNAVDFIHEVKQIQWFDVYMTENIDLAVELLTEKILKILDKMAPIQKIQCRRKYAPWISDTTKKKILERNMAQRKASESNLDNDWVLYKRLRNSVNSILRTEKIT